MCMDVHGRTECGKNCDALIVNSLPPLELIPGARSDDSVARGSKSLWKSVLLGRRIRAALSRKVRFSDFDDAAAEYDRIHLGHDSIRTKLSRDSLDVFRQLVGVGVKLKAAPWSAWPADHHLTLCPPFCPSLPEIRFRGPRPKSFCTGSPNSTPWHARLCVLLM
jgi:hypothetical protein